jgi:prevent-host-death family protein
MAAYNIYEAKTSFSALLERSSAGEEVVIAKAGKPMWKIVPLQNAEEQESPYYRKAPGSVQGDWSDLLKALDEPWDEEEQRAFGMID